MIQSATCILNGGVQCGVEAFFLCQSHNMPLLSEHHGEFSLSFPRNRLLLPMLQSKHKTFSCVIVSQSPKYCSVLSPRQINHEKTASVCFLITSSCPHKHSEMFLNSLWKGDRIYPLHQIEMFRLKYCRDINSGMCAKPGIQIRCCIRGKYSGSTPERVRL